MKILYTATECNSKSALKRDEEKFKTKIVIVIALNPSRQNQEGSQHTYAPSHPALANAIK